MSLLSPWTATAILGGIGAFLALGRGLQLGEPVAVIVAFSAAATLAAIAGGIVVFGDPMGSDALAVVGRSPRVRRGHRRRRPAADGPARLAERAAAHAGCLSAPRRRGGP